MRILLLHNRYQLAGGEDAVVRSEKALLESHGHTVSLLEADNDGITGFAAKIKSAASAFYSFPSRRRVDDELRRFRPDIVHAHNLFPVLSPSVLYVCAHAGVPVVQTLHNYRLLCPNALLFCDGAPCERCIGKRFSFPAVRRGCYRGSRSATMVVASLTAIHRAVGTFRTTVTRYIALTEFSRDKFVQGGIPAQKISVKPNFVDPSPEIGDGTGGYVLFVGRLSEEKGIDVLLRAWQNLGPKIKLIIIGTGPLLDKCMQAARENPAIECLGPKVRSEVYASMGQARALVFPSRWYETFGLTVIEAFSKGTPVIASKIGCMQELVDHGRTGLHFESGNSDSLTTQVEWMLAHEFQWKQMRTNARAEFEAKYSADKNYDMLMNIYQLAREDRR